MKLALLALIGATAALVTSIVVPRPLAVGIRGTCVNYFAFAALGVTLWLGTGAYRELVNLRVLSFFGYISYGLYLIHVIVLDLYDGLAARLIPSLSVGTSFTKYSLRLVIAILVATGVAYLSRISYEEWFLNMKEKARRAEHRPSAVPQRTKVVSEI